MIVIKEMCLLMEKIEGKVEDEAQDLLSKPRTDQANYSEPVEIIEATVGVATRIDGN